MTFCLHFCKYFIIISEILFCSNDGMNHEALDAACWFNFDKNIFPHLASCWQHFAMTISPVALLNLRKPASSTYNNVSMHPTIFNNIVLKSVMFFNFLE